MFFTEDKKMKNYLLKRGLALLLALIMCSGMLPASALAAGNLGNEPAVSQLAHKHSWGKWTVTKKATCTEKGERKRTCSVCGKTETQEIKKTDHKFGKWVVTKEATCSEKGLRSHTCTVCNTVVAEEIPTIPHIYQKWKLTEPDDTWEEFGPNDKLEETDADGFTKDGKKITITEWKVIKPASCSEKGEKIRVCAVCGDVEKKEIKKTDHSFSEWEVTEAASCSEKGEMVRVCTACGKTERKEIKKTEHSFGEWQVTKPASCTEKGEQVRICAVC